MTSCTRFHCPMSGWPLRRREGSGHAGWQTRLADTNACRPGIGSPSDPSPEAVSAAGQVCCVGREVGVKPLHEAVGAVVCGGAC